MNNQKQLEALQMFKTLCQTLDEIKWSYNKDDQNLVVRTSAIGDDLTIPFTIKVYEERSVMYLHSVMPFVIQSDKRDCLAKAVLMANNSMLNGSFVFRLNDGGIAFKIIVPFMNCTLSKDVCRYMIDISCRMIDKFNDKFWALAKDNMTLEEFARFIDNN